ncbi:hypothetical protein FOCG_05671 [Fusarium oxysporum f. sp. radicis-lycopersici 26381]|nr:hypothetical protein FOXG_21289 [Fusarium oxysporum f. sp. lycopersici 4287]EWZ35360.1 hypothetical protein FOZG_11335 [Fusarium oxysporum Fo47]EWZ96649.1 hypothetical protein FOWG_03949 [Fusarium oxysporum f. sp. lycopersici MN25]EXA37491.1 hypothetical protein FOVG_11692 [Fusarium oxysporum f. sp. pisi HDV247]EXK35030.1 hypothetical protein FOMG_10311 [Fusarium oxysporum f. sp. melonis 26406]EXL54899.1 hypothetical protein FOCG_05671 [Fusarium oxysporum f. sp. radicis-lycopersici 26381]E
MRRRTRYSEGARKIPGLKSDVTGVVGKPQIQPG